MSCDKENEKRAGKGGVYNVKVYHGGNAICGPGAKTSISKKYYKAPKHKHNKSYNYNAFEGKTSKKVQGPDQSIADIPANVYQKLEAQLSNGQSDCRSLACHVFPDITQEEIEYLMFSKKFSRNQAQGVFLKMSERCITLGQLVQALKSIERQDAIETLLEAGYPKDPDTIGISENQNLVKQFLLLELSEHQDTKGCNHETEPIDVSIDESQEQFLTQDNICISKKSYSLIIEQPSTSINKEKEDDSSQPSPPNILKGLMSAVCFVQLPNSPDEKYTSVITFSEDIKRL